MGKNISEHRQDIFWGITVVLAVILVRAALIPSVLNAPANPGLINLNGDAAKNILDGKGLVTDSATVNLISQKQTETGRLVNPSEVSLNPGTPNTYQPFIDELGYPFFLSLVWRVFPEKYIYPIIIQVILAGLAGWLVFKMARIYLPPAFSALAGFFYAFYIPEAKLAVLPHQYAWMGMILVFVSCLLLRSISKKHKLGTLLFFALATGVIMGIGTDLRSTFSLLPLIGFLVYFLSFNFKKAILASLFLAVGFSLVVCPVLEYNKVNFGQYRLTRLVFWHNVATGLGQFPNPWNFKPTDGSIADSVLKVHPDWSYPSPQSESYLRTEILSAVKANPAWWLGEAIERVPMAIFPFQQTILEGKIATASSSTGRIFIREPYDNLIIAESFLASLWIGLALWGMYLSRKKLKIFLPVIFIWLYVIGLFGLVFIQPIYVDPLSFVYAIFSAVAFEKIYSERKRWFERFIFISHAPRTS